MTALAVSKTQVAAERSLARVTRRTRLPARADEVLRRSGRTNLARLRRARGQLMTVSAFETLARAMFSVTERVTKSARVRRRGPVRLLVVTDAA